MGFNLSKFVSVVFLCCGMVLAVLRVAGSSRFGGAGALDNQLQPQLKYQSALCRYITMHQY